MTPIINPWLFYLVDVIGNFKSSCFVLLLINVKKAEDVIKDSVDYIFEKIKESD